MRRGYGMMAAAALAAVSVLAVSEPIKAVPSAAQTRRIRRAIDGAPVINRGAPSRIRKKPGKPFTRSAASLNRKRRRAAKRRHA